MCITNDVADVSKTNIFVASDINRMKQLTVYSNSVDNLSNNNMMILPVHNISSINLINMENYKDLFDDLYKSFKEQNRSFGATNSLEATPQSIPIINIGSYACSLVNNINEFNILNKETFGTINNSIISMLNQYNNCGFLVCKIRKGEINYHPIAYTNNLTDSKELFIPTIHVHGNVQEQNKLHEFDHRVYILGKFSMDMDLKPEKLVKPISFDKNHFYPFEFSGNDKLSLFKMNGLFPNRDILVKTYQYIKFIN